jgi:hypothetical protein
VNDRAPAGQENQTNNKLKVAAPMNLANRNYQEKRSFIRMKVETPIAVRLNQLVQLSGTCHNLSGGGMLISLAEPLPLHQELEVTVSSNHGHNPMLRALTRVCRLPEAKDERFMTGLEIVNLLE